MTAREPQAPTLASRLPGPEILAGVLVVALVALVGSGIVAGGEPNASGGASPSPVVSPTAAVPTPSPIVDPSIVTLLGALNGRLADDARSLSQSLEVDPLSVGDVAATIRQVNATVAVAQGMIPALGGETGPDEAGGRLAAVYDSIADEASSTLDAALANEAGYRAGAGIIVELIGQIPPIQAELDALAIAPPPTGAPTPSVRPSTTVPSPTPPPASAAPTPPPASASPPPSVPPPSGGPPPSAAPGEQIRDGGFEAGVGPPWEFRIAPGSNASLAPDTSGPGAGLTSARVEIVAGSTAYAGISLRQPGLTVDAGARYTVSIAVRAASDREIRLRIASPDGASYLTRPISVSTSWTVLSFEFVAPVSDANASVEIDLGRSDVTTWIDSVSFVPVTDAPPAP